MVAQVNVSEVEAVVVPEAVDWHMLGMFIEKYARCWLHLTIHFTVPYNNTLG